MGAYFFESCFSKAVAVTISILETDELDEGAGNDKAVLTPITDDEEASEKRPL